MKMFTTLKLAIVAIGVASLAGGTMLGQTPPPPTLPKFPTELASVLNKDILSALPPDINAALPAETLEMFRKAKFEDINTGEKYVAFLEKVFSSVEKHKVKTKVTVVDEKGNPIEGASAWVVEIRGTGKSQELYMISDSYVPYKIKQRTKKNGSCMFEGISPFNKIVLSYWLFAEEKLAIPPNLQLTVKAQGYKTTTKEFLNWDKKTLAFSTHLMAIILRKRITLPAESLKKGDFPKLAKTLFLPKENLGEVIEIRVVLKKEESKTANENASEIPTDSEETKTPTSGKANTTSPSLGSTTSSYKTQKLYYLPSDISQSLPKEIADILGNVDNIKLNEDEELLNINNKLDVWTSGQVMSANITILDEIGRPVENARAVLKQIRTFALGFNSKNLKNPLEFKSSSDKTGNLTFAKIPFFHLFSLSESLIVDGKLPEPTLRLTIEKNGFETKTVEFVNVNKTGLAIATQTNPLIGRFYTENGVGRRVKHPEPFKNPIIPHENLHKDINLKIVLNLKTPTSTSDKKKQP